jgi:SAM-dependent methyltransferase
MQAPSNFGQVAELYARARPGYLLQVFDDLIALAGIPDGGSILEIGPGTGQATGPLARRGYTISAIEPDPPLAAEASRRLQAFDNVALHVSRFEDWPLPEHGFDLVFAATAFHWLDREVRYVKSAQALLPGRALAIINTHHVAGGTQAFFVEVQSCYEAHMPGTPPGLRLSHSDDIPADTRDLAASGLFETPAVRRYEWLATYTTEQYIDVIGTYSNNLALTPENRRALDACITSLIGSRFGGEIQKQYMTELIVAKKL